MMTEDKDTAGGRKPDEPGRFGWLRAMLPDSSSIPRLKPDAWKIVLLKLIDRLPPWGMVLIIWTMVAMFIGLLIIRELSS